MRTGRADRRNGRTGGRAPPPPPAGAQRDHRPKAHEAFSAASTDAGGSLAILEGTRSSATTPVIDAVAQVAKDLGVTSAAVALAWVRERSGIASTLIGARTIAQLRAGLASLDVTLTPEHRTTPDEVSAPTLGFPAGVLGVSASLALESDEERPTCEGPASEEHGCSGGFHSSRMSAAEVWSQRR
ncbi:aldo/keto reductase [Streptomyces fagopyri]|uniref:aldo/keto reductase n=1 Tax=Streptomyces fagopyri TaxID=2662397 RepID=UPI0037F5A664